MGLLSQGFGVLLPQLSLAHVALETVSQPGCAVLTSSTADIQNVRRAHAPVFGKGAPHNQKMGTGMLHDLQRVAGTKVRSWYACVIL
jgi:hypothetical protein